MQKVLFLSPIFQERIWGGTKLARMFNYEIPSDQTGECWAVSAHPNGQSTVRNGTWQGLTLGELWASEPGWFGAAVDEGPFPLLIKILDASEDLSVQVHPDDAYASTYENGEKGKTECWYILDCDPGAEIIFGHRAANKEELREWIEKGLWEQLLIRTKVHRGDFFYVPSGTIHALGKGTVVLETQQSSDTTYRVYDYDRRDSEGRTRELHLEKALEVTSVPHQAESMLPQVDTMEDATITTFVSNSFFTVKRIVLHGNLELSLSDHTFLIYSVLKGSGSLVIGGERHDLQKGDFFILPAGVEPYQLKGSLELMVSSR